MQQLEQHSFMHELSRDVAKKLSVGLTLQQALADEVFFTPEFTQILFQGEMTGDLGKELTIYSRLSLENFQQKLQQGMQWIQPVVFFFCCGFSARNVFINFNAGLQSNRPI